MPMIRLWSTYIAYSSLALLSIVPAILYQSPQGTLTQLYHRLSPSRNLNINKSSVLSTDNEYLYQVNTINYMSPLHRPFAILQTHSQIPSLSPLYLPLTIIRLPPRLEDYVYVQPVIMQLLEESKWSDMVYLVSPDGPFDVSLHRQGLQQLDDTLVHLGVKTILVDSRFRSAYSGTLEKYRIKGEGGGISGQHETGNYLSSWSNEGNIKLYPVYRLYPDLYRIFVFGVYPLYDGLGTYRAFRRFDEDGYGLIPVPFNPELARPRGEGDGIYGKVIAVKDVYDIKGVITGAGSRAFAELDGEANDTASSIKILERLGAFIVGKTKTAAFASIGTTNDMTVDEQYPWSSRGDGYQSCAGSSSGAACAMAAYDWLDFAIGTDTGASMRLPAAVGGLYGNRPSTGALGLTGVVELFSHADTAGVFARSPSGLTKFIRSWLQDSPLRLKTHESLPKTLLAPPAYLSQHDPLAQKMVNGFIKQVSEVLDMRIDTVDLDESFDNTGWSIEKMRLVKTSYIEADHWDSWIRTGQPFIKAYEDKYGVKPIVDPSPRERWSWAESKGDWSGEFAEALKVLNEFGRWFNSEVLGYDEESCSKSILVYDIGTGGLPSYREESLNDGVNAVSPFDNHRGRLVPGGLYCPLAGCPDYTIPIGQVPYVSKLTGETVYKPVTVNMAAHRGCDLMLLDVMDKLTGAGVIGEVKVGSKAF